MRFVTTFFFVILAATGSCSRAGDQLGPGERELAGKLENVLSETRIRRSLDDSSDAPLLENSKLRVLYAQSLENEAAARSIIQDPDVDEGVKRLAILTMQCLPVESYIKLLRFLWDQTAAGHCSEALLADAVFPGEQWGTVIAEHYRDRRVGALLKEILAGAETAPLRDRVGSVLDGDAARYIEHVRETGGRAPVIGCDSRRE